jgi:uncharacterized Ntn-hydrolase superfamily protein
VTLSVAAVSGGAIGMVVASSSPAVAARCLHLRTGVGVVASQNVTNPALGSLVLDLLGSGLSPDEAVDRARASDPASAYRQLAVVDAAGRTAVYSGANTLGVHAAVAGDGVVAAGNLLASAGVVDAMLAAYAAYDGTVFEERLLTALRAGLAAGGEQGPVRSAGLAVAEQVSWPVTDLRVDDHEDPGGELGRLWELWRGQKADYLRRALDPAGAPAFGVPGDRR